MAEPRAILIMAGGTGGHIYPALAVADYLRNRQVPLAWLGSRHGMETRLVPGAGYELTTLPVRGLRGRRFLRLLTAPLELTVALVQAIRTIARLKPALVLGMGGFASGPGGLAAWLLRRPLIIHEQNAVPGLTNRWLARFADRVLEAFPGTFETRYDAVNTGNPLRADIAALAVVDRSFVEHNRVHILVFGGSSGAHALNMAVPAALRQLGKRWAIRVRHQTGESDQAAVAAAYSAARIEAEAAPYIDDMADVYRWADLVIARAGAMTVAELAVAGLPSILIPYPHHADQQQGRNADYLVDGDAAVLLPESELRPESLASAIDYLLSDPERMLRMSQAARALAIPDATERVAAICMAHLEGAPA